MKRRKTWGDVYRAKLAKGMDHGSAAYEADLWEARRKTPNDRGNAGHARKEQR